MGITFILLIILLDIAVLWDIVHSKNSQGNKIFYSLIVMLFPIIGISIYYIIRNNMKTILNILLILIAISSIMVAILKSYSMELQCTSFATALACFGATFTKKVYRYTLVGVALALMALSFFLKAHISN